MLAEHMDELSAPGEAHTKTSVVLHSAQHFTGAQEKPGESLIVGSKHRIVA